MPFSVARGLYLSPVRSTLRSLGITKLLSIPARLRRRQRIAEYERHRPTHVEVAAGAYRARMLVGDAVEYSRVLSFRDDGHILSAIAGQLRPGEVYWDVGGS